MDTQTDTRALSLRRLLRNLAAALRRAWGFPFFFYLASLVLVYSVFLPNLRDINLWDEAGYVASGKTLVEGVLPSFSSNPLVGALYALTYLLFRSSPFWLIHSVSLGRLILFSLLWVGAYRVAVRLSRHAAPIIMLGLLLVTPLTVHMLRFPSDPLFAAMAALSLSFVLDFRERGRTRDALLASFFLGLSALARNDGLILFLVFVPLMVFLAAPLARWKTTLLASLAPFVGLVGGYVLVAGLVTGSYALGTAERTYANFEAGQMTVFSGTGELNLTVEAVLEARRLFGTPVENNNSVMRAILRNPSAYGERLLALLRVLPDIFLHAYGSRFAVLLLLLAARGALALARQREFRLLAILLLWPMHLATGLVITLFREGHLLFPFYIGFGLAAIGLQSIVSDLKSARCAWAWSVVFGAIAVACYFGNKLAIFYAAEVFLVAVWLVFLARKRVAEPQALHAIAFFTVVCAGLILRGGFPSPTIRVLGQAPDEKAVLFLRSEFPPGTFVGAGAPGAVVLAGMTPATLTGTDVPSGRTPEGFMQWIRDQGIQAIYVDPLLTHESPAIWSHLNVQIGKGLERVFVAEEGNYQVLRVLPGG